MSKIETGRLLDTRYLDLEAGGEEASFFEEEPELIRLEA
jgi:hypothetical protein